MLDGGCGVLTEAGFTLIFFIGLKPNAIDFSKLFKPQIAQIYADFFLLFG